MSFFDEGDEATRERTSRRSSSATAPRGAVDQRTLLIRRGVAFGAALIILILLFVGIRGCLDSQKKNSLRDYNRKVADLIQESDSQVGKPFFQLLTSNQAGNPVELQTQINQLRVTADDLVKRTDNLDVPDEMNGAQDALLYVMTFRRDGIENIAQQIPSALARSSQAGGAVNRIAGQMQQFLASDVMYSQRTIPRIDKALDDAGIGGQTIAPSRFLPNLGWLDPAQVAQRLGSSGGGGGGGSGGELQPQTGNPTPGTHGHGITSVSVGGVELSQDETNQVPAGSNLAFTVNFQNQGENDERNVEVRVTISGAGQPIVASTRVPSTTAGADATAEIPLRQAPPIGREVTIKVEVQGVAGEQTTDNNVAEYKATFER